MSKEVRKLTEDIIDYAWLVIVAIVLIVVVYLVAQALVGEVPATIGLIIAGLAFAFIYATSENVRRSISSWAKKRKQEN